MQEDMEVVPTIRQAADKLLREANGVTLNPFLGAAYQVPFDCFYNKR